MFDAQFFILVIGQVGIGILVFYLLGRYFFPERKKHFWPIAIGWAIGMTAMQTVIAVFPP